MNKFKSLMTKKFDFQKNIYLSKKKIKENSGSEMKVVNPRLLPIHENRGIGVKNCRIRIKIADIFYRFLVFLNFFFLT